MKFKKALAMSPTAKRSRVERHDRGHTTPPPATSTAVDRTRGDDRKGDRDPSDRPPRPTPEISAAHKTRKQDGQVLIGTVGMMVVRDACTKKSELAKVSDESAWGSRRWPSSLEDGVAVGQVVCGGLDKVQDVAKESHRRRVHRYPNVIHPFLHFLFFEKKKL